MLAVATFQSKCSFFNSSGVYDGMQVSHDSLSPSSPAHAQPATRHARPSCPPCYGIRCVLPTPLLLNPTFLFSFIPRSNPWDIPPPAISFHPRVCRKMNLFGTLNKRSYNKADALSAGNRVVCPLRRSFLRRSEQLRRSAKEVQREREFDYGRDE